MSGQAALQGESIAALQAAVTRGWERETPLRWRGRREVGLVARQKVLAVQDFVERLHQARLTAGDDGARTVDDGSGFV